MKINSIFILIFFILVACNTTNPTSVKRSDAQKIKNIQYGNIISSLPVKVKGEGSLIGASTGAMIGGLLGTQVCDDGKKLIAGASFYSNLKISSDGLINIRPIDAPADAPFQLAATLGTTTAEELELEKDINGFIKPKAIINENGESEAAEITANQGVQMVNNYLEKSNVNPVEELILTLEHQRNYETHVKFIDLAKQMDEGGASLMRVPD